MTQGSRIGGQLHTCALMLISIAILGVSCSVLSPGGNTPRKWEKYTASIFDISPALIDNNQKVDVEGGIAKPQLWSDEFGSSLDGGWTVGVEYWQENGSVSETGGVCTVSAVGGGTDGAIRAKAIFSSTVYDDVTVEADFQNYDYSTADPNADGCVILRLWVDINNFVHIYMYKSSSSQRIYAVKRVGGTYNTVGEINSTSTDFKFRIVRSGDTFSFHYDDGSGWLQLGSNTSAAIGPNTRVSIQSQMDIGSLGVDVNYCRITATDDLYWDDSPEILVVDNAAVDWAFDAGSGYLWQLSDADSLMWMPGTSTIKFKIGGSDTGDDLDVLWLDTTWQTISEVKARAASGAYDANRYIHVKAQFNSDGTDQPTLSSFSIYGAKVP